MKKPRVSEANSLAEYQRAAQRDWPPAHILPEGCVWMIAENYRIWELRWLYI